MKYGEWGSSVLMYWGLVWRPAIDSFASWTPGFPARDVSSLCTSHLDLTAPTGGWAYFFFRIYFISRRWVAGPESQQLEGKVTVATITPSDKMIRKAVYCIHNLLDTTSEVRGGQSKVLDRLMIVQERRAPRCGWRDVKSWNIGPALVAVTELWTLSERKVRMLWLCHKLWSPEPN